MLKVPVGRLKTVGWQLMPLILVIGLSSLVLVPLGKSISAVEARQAATLPQRPELVLQFNHPSAAVSAVFAPDGRTIATGGGSVKIWDAQTGGLKRTLAHDHVSSISFSPDGRLLAAGTGPPYAPERGRTRVWDIRSGARQIAAFPDSHVVGFARDGKLLLATERGLEPWDLQTRKRTRLLPADFGAYFAVAPNGRMVAIGYIGLDDGYFEIWDLVNQRRLFRSPRMSNPEVLAFSRDSHMLATGHFDGTLRTWNAVNGQLKQMAHVYSREMHALVFSADDRLIAVIGKEDKLWGIGARGSKILDAKTLATVHTLNATKVVFDALAFSPDGTRLATAGQRPGPGGSHRGSELGDIRLWDTKTGTLQRRFVANPPWAEAVEFSADGRRLAIGSADGGVRIWGLEGRVETILPHEYGIQPSHFRRMVRPSRPPTVVRCGRSTRGRCGTPRTT